MLIFYHNLSNNNVPLYFKSFIPKHSQGNHRYTFRNPKYQIPKYEHVYIKLTCRYQLPHILNYYMTHDQNDDVNSETAYLPFIMENTVNVSLNCFKRIIKSHLINKYSSYCTIRNCYVCQLYEVFSIA